MHKVPSALDMSDRYNGTPYSGIHTPMWGEQETGLEWQSTFPDRATKLGRKQCEGVPAMYNLQKPDGGITEMITYVNDYLSGEANFLSEESNYPDSATKMGPGRATKLGRKNGEGVPAMYTFQKPDGGITEMITNVDDFLIAESNTNITDATLAKLKEQFEELAVQRNPDSFSGYKVSRDRKTRAITLSMPQKIIEATRTHLPEALDGEGKVKVLKGGKLADVADGLELDQASKETKKLDAQQKTTQSIIGSLKFVEKIMPEISVALHRLSCVMSAPPVEALAVAKGVLHYAYLHKTNGITYGGTNGDEEYNEEHVGIEGRAPIELSATADATWGDGRNIYGLLVTYNRGSIAHMTKKIRAIVESSHHSEAIATSEATKQVMYAREVLRALHEPQRMATKIATDNRANLLVANDATSAKRARHFLRQYHILQQRIESDEIAVCKLPTSVMPADFLTKWIAGNKVKKSTEYATNSTAYVNS
jgi:hypothetical protein